MENKLIKQLEETMPSGMSIPEELKLLYHWIERNHLFMDSDDGKRHGFLFHPDEMKETEEGREGGTDISFRYSDPTYFKFWFGYDGESEEVNSRLCSFAKSGMDGSQCALWKADDGKIKVVHMGSGSGSVLCCVLADNMIDFIRLLAIGYDEICWEEEFSHSPSENEDFIVKPNLKFQQWVRDTFHCDIPKTALDIVKYPASMDDESSEDEFFNWCLKVRK